MVFSPNMGAAEVTINSFLLDAPQSSRPIALSSLDGASWSQTEAIGADWLIIRKLSVQAQSWELGKQTSVETENIARQAVDGWSASAGGAQAVRFRDTADLIACLSRDIALGIAERLWFWGGWLNTPATPALTDLWVEHVTELPQLFLVLEKKNALRKVLAFLPAFDVVTLFQCISRKTGWPLPPLISEEHLIIEPSAAGVEAELDAVAELQNKMAYDLQSIEPGRRVVIAQFLALLQLWQHRPSILLSRNSARVAVKAIARALLTHSDLTDHSKTQFPQSPTPDISPAAMKSARLSARADDVTTPPSPHHSDVSPEKELSDNSGLVEQPSPVVNSGPDVGDPEWQNLEDEAAGFVVPAEEFITSQGGVFYLINALSRPDVREHLIRSGADGWLWIWHTALALELEPEPGLVRFLAERLNCKEADEIFELHTPAHFGEVRRLLEKHYLVTGVWNSDLLECAALVRFSASHLDIHMQHENARTDVRRAGLDRDPGWTDWLGRIVSFNFGNVPELAGMARDD